MLANERAVAQLESAKAKAGLDTAKAKLHEAQETRKKKRAIALG